MEKKDNYPFFSIIIPCYNQVHFLPECINSIFEQNYQNWEAIIVNDGSTDNTSQVASEFAEKDSRIKLVEKKNGGLSSARNKGISTSCGNYIIFLDSDDLIINNCLSKYEKIVLEGNEFIQSGYLCFNKNIDNILYKRTNISKYDDFLKTILSSNVGPVNGFVVSKKIVDKVGFFNEELTSCEDWDYWIRCAKLGYTPYVVNDLLSAFRFVPGSMSKNSIRMLEQGLLVINCHHFNYNSKLILNDKLKDNPEYKKASLGYLMFATGIALFNNHYDSIEIIKNNYFKKINDKIEMTCCDKISNYQTYRVFSISKYFIFYFRNKKRYHVFFNYLIEKNIVDINEFKSLRDNIFPNPFFLNLKKVFKKLKKE